MQHIAMFGGSFNPIHLGHLHLCRAAQEAFAWDQVLLMPSNLPPHKTPADLPASEHRLAMCRLAVADDPTISVSDLELKRGGVSYTLTTLEQLRTMDSDATISLMIGSDMLYTFHQWYGYEEILYHHPVVTVARERGEYQQMLLYLERLGRLAAKVTVLQAEAYPVSSTQVRAAVRAGQSTEGLLDPAVRAYIDTHGLYRSEGACPKILF